MSGMNYKLIWEKSIESWDEAIPLGCGSCGCLCWGKAEELRFSLDRTDIWDKEVTWEQTEEFTYRKLAALAKAGNTKRIREIFDAPYYHLTPTKLPAGKIFLHFPHSKGSGNVSSVLDLGTACASLAVDIGRETCRIHTWIHRIRQIGVIEVNQAPDGFAAELKAPGFGQRKGEKTYIYNEDNRRISQGTLQELQYEPAQYGCEKKCGMEIEWFVQEISEDFSYGVVMGRETKAGQLRILWKILSSEDGADWLEDGKRSLLSFAAAEKEALFREHCDWWSQYYGRSSISIPDAFVEKQWYLANYLLASASRKGTAPMPLQGVWTADDGMLPPWKGDYHHDLNTELSYSHYLKANHLEEGECFLDFLWELMEEGRHFAREFYGTEGMCLPSVMTIDGKALGGWPMYSLSPANQIWLARSFEQYYRYTGDESFLKERAYPYLRETGRCIQGLLEEQEDGMLALPISSSPEIHDDTERAWLKPISNYDLALMQYLFETLKRLAEKLNLPEAKEWQEIREKLPDLYVNEKNVLMLSGEESLMESHRHLSNAMAVSPLELITYEGEGKQIIDAVISDYERLGTRNWVGYTFTWMAHFYGIQGNGEKAARMLKIFWEYFCGPNGFHLNGDYKRKGYSDFTYRPFTLEGNMFAADALQEMLFQMKDGQIRLFPAIPEKWRRKGAGFGSFRGEKGLLCSGEISQEGVSWKITAELPQKIQLICGKDKVSKTLAAGEIWEGFIPAEDLTRGSENRA